MLRQRLITGPILIGVLILLVWLDAEGIAGAGSGTVFAVAFAMLIPIASVGSVILDAARPAKYIARAARITLSLIHI